MHKRIRNYVDNCLICFISNSVVNSREEELQITDNLNLPVQVLHSDHFGPLSELIEGFKHILLIVDAFTRFTWLIAVKSTNTKETLKHFISLFNTFGNPHVIITDRGTTFSSNEFSDFVQERKIRHRMIAIAAPWANVVLLKE